MQGVGRASDRRTGAIGASRVALAVAVLALTLLVGITPAPAQVITAVPGDTIASEMAAGRIVSISPDNQVRELASGLSSPRGVAVLVDGSILVAETGKNRIVGIGGRFGAGAPKEIVSVPFPEGLSVSPDGTVYVTLLQAGEMGRVDIDAGTYTPIARDLEGPGDVAVRGIAMFVTESGPDGRVVTQVAGDGRKAEFSDGYTQPIGLAFGAGATLFVADFRANRILRVDASGNTTVFATVDAPVHLAVEPHVPAEGAPFTVVATTAEGMVRFDFTGARTGAAPLTGAAGIATVPGTGPGGSPGPTVPTTAPTATTTVTPTTAGEVAPQSTAPATTRPPRTTTSLSEEEGAPSSTSGGILVASLVIIGLIVVGAAVFAVMQRDKSGDKSGFEERPLDTNTVALAFGACAAEEVELAEAEGGLASLELQSETAEKRLAAATERVQVARAELVEARRAARASGAPRAATAPSATAAASGAAPSEAKGLRLEDLELTTAAGKAALNAFLKREIEADELEEMWRALGEDHAIEVVRAARPPATPDPHGEATAPGAAADDREGPADGAEVEPEPDPETIAEAVLAEAESDVEHAHAEIARLREREDAAVARISTARASLEACQASHQAELAAEATASADAAVAAAATGRSSQPPAPPAPSTVAEPTTAPEPAADADAATPEAGTEPGAAARPGPPVVPEREPLVADAATVAALRRPKADTPAPTAAPAPAAPTTPAPSESAPEATAPAEEAPAPAAATDSEATPATLDEPLAPPTSVRREGLDRGLFDSGRDDAGNPRAATTFPTPSPAAGDGPSAGPTPPADDPAPGPEPEPGEPAEIVDPEPMAPEPVAPARGTEPGLGEVLFRSPAEAEAEVAPASSAKLDDLVFAWPASGFQKLPATEGEGAADPEPEPEPEPEPQPGGREVTGGAAEPAAPDEGRGDEPRPDLKFL